MIEFLILDLSASLSLILLYIINKLKMKKLERKVNELKEIILVRQMDLNEKLRNVERIKKELNKLYGTESVNESPKIYYYDTDSITRIGN